MRSPRAEALRALLLAAACAAQAQDAGPAPASVSAPVPSPHQRAVRIQQAVEALRADPLLSGKHMEHRLRWIDDEEPEKKPDDDSSLLQWFATLASFINDISRFLLWGAVAALVALALVGARHVIRLRAFGRGAKAASAISHVRDLDVRPESLPDDVGAAAWALWQAGRVPEALSLLYRGALSRLIHRYRVPITASATEGECLELARPCLETPALRYVTQVVRAWEASTYGGRALSAAMGEALCSGFAPRLDGRPQAGDAP